MSDIMQQIAERTNGDLYIGVVGPIQIGKSTFVKRMMEAIVLPHIVDEDARKRAMDELPQSSPGQLKVHPVDCVGYVIDGVKGHQDEDGPKFVQTPWQQEPIPFKEAAKIGTDKVIRDHANIGIVITTDETVNVIARTAAEPAEIQIIGQLNEIGKLFIIVLNSVSPSAKLAQDLRNELFAKYGVPVLTVAVDQMTEADIQVILNEALYEFPVEEIELERPDWLDVLALEHPLNMQINEHLLAAKKQVIKIRDVQQLAGQFMALEDVAACSLQQMDLGLGIATLRLEFVPEAFRNACNEWLEEPIISRKQWLLFIKDASEAKNAHNRFKVAIEDAEIEGYGMTLPEMDEVKPEEPELIQQDRFYGVRMKATAAAYHIIRVDMATEFAPLIGSQFHSEHLLKELKNAYENDLQALWQTQLFGSSLHEVLTESIRYKMERVPLHAKTRMRQMIERMVNEEEKGLVTFIL